MSRVYKLTDTGITAYMKQHLAGHSIIGETADSFIIQSGRTKSTRSVSKGTIEKYHVTEGYVDSGIAPKENENFGMKASRLAGEDKAKGKTMSQIQDRFNDDPVYNAALADMDPQTREQYRAKMNGASNDERIRMVNNVRDNYAQKKFDADQYARSVQAANDRIEEEKNRPSSVPYKGNKSYGSTPTNQ